MPQALLAIFTQIASVIGGGINGALGMMTSLISKGFQATVQFHKEGIAFAREVGLSAREAQAYTQVLTERTEKLALKYGVAADAIKEVQRGIIDATGKQYMLNEAEAERQVQINKLVGAGTANQFTEQMMNHMGAQLSTVQGAVSKAYATAAKSGLNAAKFSKEVAKNLSLANKLSFRDGVNGIIRMTALSEKLGFNLQSVENAANKFMELDSAIESSAQLQMLGGAAGAYGSNPLTMAYEANYDPEAFTERMTKMLGGYAQFDRKTGMANVNGMNRDFVKNIASAMGISMDEAMSIAKKQAEIKYKEGAYTTELGRISKENRDAVLNRSYVDTDTGHLMINDASGKAHDITKNGLDESILKELQEFDNMSEKDIMQRQAETLTDIQAQINGIGDSFAASIAKHLNQYIPEATTAIKNFAKEVQPSVVEIGRNVGEIVKTALDWLRENKETIKNVAKGVFGVTAWLTKHWPLLIALWAGKKLLGASLPGGTTVGGKLGAKALGGLKNIGQRMSRSGIAKPTMDTYRMYNARYGGSKIKNFGAALKNSWKSAPKLTKATGIAGVALGAVQGATALMDYSTKKKELKNKLDTGEITKDEYNAQINEARVNKNESVGSAVGGTIGAAIGTAFGGPVGAIIAGYIGDKLGGFIGKHWDGITKRVSNAWNTSINWVSDTTSSIVKGIGNKLSSWGESVSNWWGEVASPAISESMSKIKDKAKSFMSGIGDKFNNFWDEQGSKIRVLSKINPITGILTEVIEFFRGPSEHIKRAKNAFKNVIKTITSFPETIEQWLYDYTKDKKWLPTIGVNHREKNVEKHADGGIVGGNSYSGDRILTGLNSGEMVLNKDQQAQLFKFIQNASSILTKISSSNGVTHYNASNRTFNSSSNNTLSNILSTIFNSNSNVVSSALNTNNNIKTTPFGENSFRKIPKSDYTEYSYNKGGEITVKDINLNVNGTLKLDAGTFTKNLDINQLLSDTTFISSLKDLIKQSINNDINNGRFMNDIASMRGMPSQVGSWGRK